MLMTPLQNLDFWDRLPEIDAPVLIVHGADDPIPVEMVRELDASLPQSELVIVEGAGHFPFIERPGRFFGAIQRFVDTRVDVPDAGEDAP